MILTAPRGLPDTGLAVTSITQYGEPLPGTLEAHRDGRRGVTLLYFHPVDGPHVELGEAAHFIELQPGGRLTIDWRAVRFKVALGGYQPDPPRGQWSDEPAPADGVLKPRMRHRPAREQPIVRRDLDCYPAADGPPPAAGQVWAWHDDPTNEDMVVQVGPVSPDGSRYRSVIWGSGKRDVNPADWPPSGRVLVSGRGSPWAPPEEPG